MTHQPLLPTQATPQPGGFVAFVRRHPLFSYFFIAILLSWLGWVPVALSQTGLGLLPFRFPGPPGANLGIVGGALGPIGSGFLCTALVSGKAGLRQFLRRFLLWRVGFWWYVFAIFGCPILIMLGIFATVPGALTAFIPSMLPTVLLIFVGLLIAGMFVSSLVEEPGWRGFALPRLQERYGPLTGSLILGLCWGLWHLPLFTIPGYDGAGTGFLGIIIPWAEFTVALMGASIIMTWMFNHTKGSIFMAMIFHASIDGFPRSLLFPASYLRSLVSPLTLVAWPVLALVLLIVTRGTLGYQGNVSVPVTESLPSDSAFLDKAEAETLDKKGLEWT
jgi:membrane protease YdiL (CAAX protease family)